MRRLLLVLALVGCSRSPSQDLQPPVASGSAPEGARSQEEVAARHDAGGSPPRMGTTPHPGASSTLRSTVGPLTRFRIVPLDEGAVAPARATLVEASLIAALALILNLAGNGRSGLDHRSHRIHARSPHLADMPSVIIASERMDDDPGWRLLAPGELVHVDRTLRISSSQPLPAIPSHLLTLAELDEAAAASQHPTPSEAVGRGLDGPSTAIAHDRVGRGRRR